MIDAIRKKMIDELTQLDHELEVVLPKAIEIARGHGDLSENADYSAALERRDFCQSRVRHLLQQVAMLQEVKEEDIPVGEAGLGSLVTLLDCEDNEEEQVELVVGGGETKAGQVTIGSPYGRALKGHKVGDEVAITLPFGTRTVKIIKLKTIHEIVKD